MKKLLLAIILALPFAALAQTTSTNVAWSTSTRWELDTNQYTAWKWRWQQYVKNQGTNEVTAQGVWIRDQLEASKHHQTREAQENFVAMQNEADARARMRQVIDRLRLFTEGQLQFVLTNAVPNL
jgi:hypothetical protein